MADKILFVAEDLQLSIGRQTVFDHTAMSVYENERLALIGRNGCGKSTLLRIIAGKEKPGDGVLAPMRNLRVSMMEQDYEPDSSLTVRQNVACGMSWFYELLRRYEDKHITASEHDEIEHQLTLHDAWNPEVKLNEIMDKLVLNNLSGDVALLSGGEKRRIALAAAVVGEPDLLLLDEPTNHLDVATVEWIEDFLAGYRGSCLFVTHDRFFLDRLATRILELDNGKFFSYEGSYADFMEAKMEREAAEDVAESKRKKFLRSEIEWVRRSPKARLRRNLGRLKNYAEIAAVKAPVRADDIELVIPPAPRLGNQTVILKNVTMSYPGEEPLFSDFSFEFMPGAKIGIVGPNGIGKSTLLKLITGELAPVTGEVKIASTIEFNYIDQSRLALDPEKSVLEEISEGGETVILGREKISIWGYLKRFLFEDERINTQIKFLSGGEKARLTMAKILKQGGNFLILDEPTNDLDLSSLRLLEEALMFYDGCVIVVSHDRYFLNRVCDGILAFEGRGKLYYTPGDFDYYVAKRAERQLAVTPAAEAAKVAPKPERPKKEKSKLSFREEKELAGMEEAIAAAEEKIAGLEVVFSSPDFFARHGVDCAELQSNLAAAKAEAERLYLRWEELETLKINFAEV